MSAPYCDIDGVQVYLGDCREVTEWLAADVLVTDPPYGMGFVSGSRTRSPKVSIEGDSDPAIRDEALRLWGDVKPGLVFGTWRIPAPRGERQRLIWWKRGGGPGMGNLALPWGTCHEDIHILGQGWDREAAGVRRAGSVLTTTRGRGGASGPEVKFDHPTPKPLDLMEELILACPRGVIADPFAGSGSTLVAARNLGRRAIGVEIEERYAEIIAKRLSQAALPLDIPAQREADHEVVPLIGDES